MTADELHTALESGQTIAQIAAAKGVDVQKVIDAMVAAANTHIDSEVSSGRLTQAEGDQRKADVVARITDMVNNGGPAGGRHGGPGHHGPPPADANGQSNGTTDTTA
jgi:hypothetical protein